MSTIPARLLPQQVTIEPFEGSGAYGASYGDPMVYPARVAYQNRLVRTDDGSETVATATVVTVPIVVAPPGSRITLPGETGTRDVLGYSPHVGAREVHHVEIDVG